MISEKYLKPRFAEIGKIKIGGKGEKRVSKKSGKEYRLPIKYEHFVVTSTARDPRTGNYEIRTDLMKKLSEDMRPREIPIVFIHDDIDMIFHTSFQRYEGKKNLCRGDGVTSVRFDQGGNEIQGNCDPDRCKHFQEGRCKVSGILSCMITLCPEFGGVFRFRTHSWNTVSSILATLIDISGRTNGILEGIPFKMKFLKKSTEEHGDITMVTIVLDGDLVMARRQAIETKQNRTQLLVDMRKIEERARQSGFLDDTDSPEDIQEEFYPEVVEPTRLQGKGLGAIYDEVVDDKISKPQIVKNQADKEIEKINKREKKEEVSPVIFNAVVEQMVEDAEQKIKEEKKKGTTSEIFGKKVGEKIQKVEDQEKAGEPDELDIF